MRTFFSFIVALILLTSFRVHAQQNSGAVVKIYKIAILPTLTNIQKKVLRTDIDSASWAQIQEKEAYNDQSKNYYLLAQKNPNYNLVFQSFNQTNALLQQAGITYNMLASINQQELATLLGVDLIFYGMKYRVADPNSPEERMAINMMMSALLPVGVSNLARKTDKPITTMHYLLYDRIANKAVWHYKAETIRTDNTYLYKLRNFLAYNFPLRK